MSDQRASQLPGAVWFRQQQPRPRRAPALSRERIVAAAIALLDRDGTQGLSLRKMAVDLDVHATSLYWHVSTKSEVLDLALDEVFAEIDLPQLRTGEAWRDLVLAYMHQLRSMLLRHPWAAPLAGSRPLAGPHALERSEAVYAGLRRAGFSGEELSAAAGAVTHLVVASASTQTAWAQQAEGESREALRRRITEDAERYPVLSAHFADFLGDWDTQFELATRFLVDGFSSRNR